ncbi:IclR family transcriptional regulator C-terminal domain-containing protein [Caballeronia sp. LZ034LL]|uniref:IclR family transcriptional regulator n=1 Tax=Caballeronia sp. LZ034LL TaxID=3038567 RepID=UPI0028583F5F|nr:IclR family transcriptional regulator C-terminal domain-containing protein [Caballeronia sp. LZ034LL]MDR5838590.1 IclR family transcriptional regulator C-terminal domain-containing protein [Caballeronia sp. LZ034LL]
MTMPAPDVRPQRGINALDATGDLLHALVAADGPLLLRDLAAAAGMPPAKAFAHLVSLVKVGLLSRDDAGRFHAGPLSRELGLIALQRLSPVRDAEAEIVALAAATSLTVAAATLGPLGPTVIRLEESARPQHVSLRIGTAMSLVNTAIGRVFAAHVGDEVRTSLLQQDGIRLAGVAPASFATSDGENYRATLSRIREQGFDTALDAPVPGIHSLAAPVFDHTGSVCLVLALIGSAGGFDSAADGPLARTLLAATRRLSWRFGLLEASEAS